MLWSPELILKAHAQGMIDRQVELLDLIGLILGNTDAQVTVLFELTAGPPGHPDDLHPLRPGGDRTIDDILRIS